MNTVAIEFDMEMVARVEQFYYKEARLLDERLLQQWFTLIDESFEYDMPTRFVPHPDPKLQDTEAFLSVDRELDRAEGPKGSPIRHDNYMGTFARTFRAYKTNAWSESPAPRTRRTISNVEVTPLGNDQYRTFSNFMMFYSHLGKDNHFITGGRRDVLKEVDGGFKLLKREVIIDMDIITVPTLALIF